MLYMCLLLIINIIVQMLWCFLRKLVSPHKSDVGTVYSFLCCVCLFMHEWVTVTVLLVRQALWHDDRMRSPHCWMTRSPCQPPFHTYTHTSTHTHTHFIPSLNKSAQIMVMPLAVNHCPTLQHTHKIKEIVCVCVWVVVVVRRTKWRCDYFWVIAESQ